MTSNAHLSSPRYTHPFVYLILIIPFGATSGFLGVTLAYLLKKAGVNELAIAGLLAISYVPHTWKFLWAPVIDTILRRKIWYLIGSVCASTCIFMMGALPATEKSMPILTIVVLLAMFSTTLVAMSVESLMAHGTATDQMGRAAGWFQAGNLGGSGIGGGLALMLAERTEYAWLPGATLALACFSCCIALLFTAEPEKENQDLHLLQNLREILKDVWDVSKSRMGYMGLLICFLPIGSGAASNAFAVIAGQWHATADMVATTNGTMNGLVSAGACIIGGYICDRIDRKYAYALFGVLMSMVAVGMAWSPRTPTMYAVFVLLYAFVTGLAYAGFTAVVLEAIGKGAAATKYSLFASLSNMPIGYMTMVNGLSNDKWGTNALLYSDAAAGIIGLIIFIAVNIGSKRFVR
jgi:MFS family permease